ncbi:MAG: DnaB-like helicase C-terminal domain-containing protein, partial [Mariprofundales bacterium]|nr:DnaB-like helicase C-terminal domain-containing protein [Mariprofundales bacterium]
MSGDLGSEHGSSVEEAFVWHVARSEKLLAQVVASGVGPQDLVGAEEKRAMRVLTTYFARYSTLPGDDALEEILGSFHHHGLESEFCIAEVMKRKLFGALRTMLAEVEWDLRSGSVEKAFERVQAIAQGAGATPLTHPDNLLSIGPKVMEFYDKVRNGYEGISLPWPTLSGMMRGLWPGTTTMFVARPGVGKTFVAVVSARHAWLRHGISPLVVSPEMGKLEMAERFFVVHSGVSYADVVRGTLSDLALEKLRGTVEEVAGDREAPPVWIMGPDDDLSPQSIDRAIRETKPGLVA